MQKLKRKFKSFKKEILPEPKTNIIITPITIEYYYINNSNNNNHNIIIIIIFINSRADNNIELGPRKRHRPDSNAHPSPHARKPLWTVFPEERLERLSTTFAVRRGGGEEK
jgi:hypothetical protein